MTNFDSNLIKLEAQLEAKYATVDKHSHLVYRWVITTHDSKVYQYVGKAKNYNRPRRDYLNNLCRIRARSIKSRSGKGYRVVHFALYKALEKGWKICHCWQLCSTEDKAKKLEQQLICKYKSNLNKKINCKVRNWEIEELDSLTMGEFVEN